MANKFSLGTLAVLLAVSPTLFGMEPEQNLDNSSKPIVTWQPGIPSFKIMSVPLGDINAQDLFEKYGIAFNNVDILNEIEVDEESQPVATPETLVKLLVKKEQPRLTAPQYNKPNMPTAIQHDRKAIQRNKNDVFHFTVESLAQDIASSMRSPLTSYDIERFLASEMILVNKFNLFHDLAKASKLLNAPSASVVVEEVTGALEDIAIPADFEEYLNRERASLESPFSINGYVDRFNANIATKNLSTADRLMAVGTDKKWTTPQNQISFFFHDKAAGIAEARMLANKFSGPHIHFARSTADEGDGLLRNMNTTVRYLRARKDMADNRLSVGIVANKDSCLLALAVHLVLHNPTKYKAVLEAAGVDLASASNIRKSIKTVHLINPHDSSTLSRKEVSGKLAVTSAVVTSTTLVARHLPVNIYDRWYNVLAPKIAQNKWSQAARLFYQARPDGLINWAAQTVQPIITNAYKDAIIPAIHFVSKKNYSFATVLKELDQLKGTSIVANSSLFLVETNSKPGTMSDCTELVESLPTNNKYLLTLDESDLRHALYKAVELPYLENSSAQK
jgi:hypothetical protein